MLPESDIPEIIEEGHEFASKTYGIDFKNKKMVGNIDGYEAVNQAIYKMLATERYEFPLHPHSYGIETYDLVGNSRLFVESELPRRIRETLLEDDRIINVTNFVHGYKGDTFRLYFDVITDYGRIEMERSFNLDE